MVNPASIMKLLGAKNQFKESHPKFAAFLKAMAVDGIEEGTVIELTVTRPGQKPMTTNLKVRQSDLEFFEGLKEMES